MQFYDFGERLEFSKGIVSSTAEATILRAVTGCVSVEKSTIADDRNGNDYWATLRGGAVVGIDHKARETIPGGIARFWNTGPELSLEVWSVMPDEANEGKAGWTLDESKRTDMTLHTFDPADSDKYFLLPFQHLRMAFRKNYATWTDGRFKQATQNSGRWKSQCLFVPAWCVLDAIREVSSNGGAEPLLFT